MARWTHLFPSRTQKLSTVVAKVSLWARIASCRAFFYSLDYVFVLHISQYVLQYCVITIERKDYYEY